jgi:hypothetical protein
VIPRTHEGIRRFPEHGARLRAFPLGFSEDASSLPHGARPLTALPHARDALRLVEVRARTIKFSSSRAGAYRSSQESHRARLARLHLGQLPLSLSQDTDRLLRIRGGLDLRTEHSHDQVSDDIGVARE